MSDRLYVPLNEDEMDDLKAELRRHTNQMSGGHAIASPLMLSKRHTAYLLKLVRADQAPVDAVPASEE